MASSESVEGSQSRTVRGITKCKSTQRMVKKTKAKIFVKVDLEVNAFVGESASQLTQVLGTLVREHAPTNAIYWKDFDPITKDAIAQGALDWFDIEGYGTNDQVAEIINAECQNLFRFWKSRAKQYYNKVVAEGKDPNAHRYPSMDEDKWKFMITNVWNTDSFKKCSEINQANREQRTYNHTVGPQSFASKFYEFTVEARKREEQPKFSEFYKSTHTKGKKKEVWIDERCEEDYEALKQLEDESFINGEELSPAELSQKVFGKKNYLKGLGPNMKLKKKIYCKPNSIHSGEMQAELETLRSLNKENEEKFVSQDAMNKLLRVQIESQNKKIEALQIRHTRFVDLILSGGSSVDLNLIRQIDSD